MTTTVNMPIDEYTLIKRTEQAIRDGAMNRGQDGIFTAAEHSNGSLTERTSTTVAGLSLGLAFALAGAVLGLAVRF